MEECVYIIHSQNVSLYGVTVSVGVSAGVVAGVGAGAGAGVNL